MKHRLLPFLAASLVTIFLATKLAKGEEPSPEPSPERAAELAADAGDFRYMSAPSCFDGLPGYYGGKRPDPWPPKVAGAKCEDLVGEDVHRTMEDLAKFASSYNSKMRELRQKEGYDH